MTPNNPPNIDRTSMVAEQIRQTHNEGTLGPLQVQVEQATKLHVDKEWGTYTMNSTPRGLAVVLNYENFPNRRRKRSGSCVDVLNVRELCEQLGFNLEIYQDLGKEETLEMLDEVVNNPLLPHVDMLMVFIMSHGDRNEIDCSDGKYLDTEDILEKFTCPVLRGKPKFIVFQACRGSKKDLGIPRKVETDARPINHVEKDPSWKDIIVAYSTVPGFVSYRDPCNGTWFIQSLVKVFMKNACHKDLLLLLRDVGDIMEEQLHEDGYKQSFVYENRHFNRKLYFNPGLNENDTIINVYNLKMWIINKLSWLASWLWSLKFGEILYLKPFRYAC